MYLSIEASMRMETKTDCDLWLWKNNVMNVENMTEKTPIEMGETEICGHLLMKIKGGQNIIICRF